MERHADQGVEVSWLHQAGFGALTDVFLLAGVGSAVVALSGLPLSGTAALMGRAIIAVLSLARTFNRSIEDLFAFPEGPAGEQ